MVAKLELAVYEEIFDMAISIITITGASGVGKTTIARKLLKLPNVEFITSLTSRPARPTDLPGEYRYNMTDEAFAELDIKDAFFWMGKAHGNTYATLNSSLAEALADGKIHLMLLVPDSVKKLIKKYPKNVFPIFIISPPEKTLRKRLAKRGDSPSEIEKRIADCKTFNADAFTSGIPYTYISNDRPINETFNGVKLLLRAIRATNK